MFLYPFGRPPFPPSQLCPPAQSPQHAKLPDKGGLHKANRTFIGFFFAERSLNSGNFSRLDQIPLIRKISPFFFPFFFVFFFWCFRSKGPCFFLHNSYDFVSPPSVPKIFSRSFHGVLVQSSQTGRTKSFFPCLIFAFAPP